MVNGLCLAELGALTSLPRDRHVLVAAFGIVGAVYPSLHQ